MKNPGVPLRPAQEVMSLRRATASVPTPLSFPRAAMRELVRGRWQVRKLRFELDEEGRGEVLYRLEGGGWTFHFFLVANKLAEEQKTDRNFAASWDAMGVLCQGEWTPEREAHLRREVPKQRAGYADYDTLVYARGNRSARVFDHVVDRLASGQQPDLAFLAPVGYILRTTAFIGNGQLGTRPLAGYEPDHPLRRPYHAQFASGFMLREYVFDLVDHLARVRSPKAVRMAPAWRRYLGLGNSAATGLSAFVANHPHLMHQWTRANEEALALAKKRPVRPQDATLAQFAALLEKAILHFEQAARPGDGVFMEPQALAVDLARLREPLAEFRGAGTVGGAPVDLAWEAMAQWAAAHLSAEALEVLNSLVLEVHPDVVEQFTDRFLASEACEVEPAMTVGALAELIDRDYDWALHVTSSGGAARYFWYRSASAPRDVRRGLRGPAPEYENETTLDTLLQVRRLREHLARVPVEKTVADVTTARPDLRHIVARVQSLAGLDYAELRYDWLAADFSPFSTIRYPLTFFGMEKQEAAPPKSVRGVFMQGAPIAEDVAAGRDGSWPFPLIPADDAQADIALAPMPVGSGAAPKETGARPRTLKVAPNELARAMAVALQGHGAAFGVAEDAGQCATFAQAGGAPALAALLRHCRDGIVARGASALTVAPAALDRAVAQASRAGLGVVAVPDAADAWLVQELVLRCARRGLFGVLAWQGGFAAGIPDAAGAAFARGGDPAVLRQCLQPLRDHAIQQVLQALAQQDDSGARFLLVASRPGAPAAIEALVAALAQPRPGHAFWPAAEVESRRYASFRHGIELELAEFEALAEAGKALLVPPQEEHRFLPEGMDPLKSF